MNEDIDRQMYKETLIKTSIDKKNYDKKMNRQEDKNVSSTDL